MSICHAHNLVQPLATEKRHGIRVRVRGNDPFCNLVGKDWGREHWYSTVAERDQALAQMSEKYVYFRPGDKPALDFQKIEK